MSWHSVQEGKLYALGLISEDLRATLSWHEEEDELKIALDELHCSLKKVNEALSISRQKTEEWLKSVTKKKEVKE